MSRFLDNAASIFDAADAALQAGESPTPMTILLGVEGGIRMIANSDWSLDALQSEYGAEMAYRVTQQNGRVAVEGHAGPHSCRLQTAHPAQVLQRLRDIAPTSSAPPVASCRPNSWDYSTLECIA